MTSNGPPIAREDRGWVDIVYMCSVGLQPRCHDLILRLPCNSDKLLLLLTSLKAVSFPNFPAPRHRPRASWNLPCSTTIRQTDTSPADQQ